MSKTGWTGRSRARKTSLGIRVSEAIAHGLITLGGFGTIAAVVLIFGFLLSVVIPLFVSGSLEEPTSISAASSSSHEVLFTSNDELKTLRVSIHADGRAFVHRTDGTQVSSENIFGDRAPRCWARDPGSNIVAFGFGDGSVCQGTIGFATRFLSRQEARTFFRENNPTGSLSSIALGTLHAHPMGVVVKTQRGDARLQYLQIEMGDPIKLATVAIERIDISVTAQGPVLAALSADGKLALYETSEEMDMMTGEMARSVERYELPYEPSPDGSVPAYLLLNGAATNLIALWRDGTCQRYDTRRDAMILAEKRRVIDSGAVTAASWTLGKSTLLVGDNRGRIGAWFAVRDKIDERASLSSPGTPIRLPKVSEPTTPLASSSDALTLKRAHELGDDEVQCAVTHLAPSARARFVVAGYENGTVRVVHITTTKELVQTTLPDQESIVSISLSPKDDAVVALGSKRVHSWNFSAGHPEATFGTLFTPVWYEGYPEPEHVWQSSGGDAFEPKLGMWPLIVGTLKATFYAMLFAGPLALLAAVFTSQFLPGRARAPIKTAVEMMAGVPSVVLGFVAAIVIAPYVQEVLPTVLLAFVLMPFALLLGARLWQAMPARFTRVREGTTRFLTISAFLLLGVGLAALLGPVLSRVFFDGDLVAWLGRTDAKGSALAWSFFALPLGALTTVFLMSSVLRPRFRRWTHEYSREQSARADLWRFALGLVVTLVITLMIAGLLHVVVGDPRHSFLKGYAQKNALIVGFVMGFAIIPIIFTLADDALNSVPKRLKEGSLGAGATRWQTTWRVILPAATSGLFGAFMVGLGRAVGETMIVLMAAGNSPIMDIGWTTGCRTLSANTAVELPEAVRDSTHYRTLFLAALVLFVMTFIINTIAEIVRRRFRRRFAQL